jgi:transposase-like protein
MSRTRSEKFHLTDKQKRAIDALLVGATDQQAADAAGVARSTLGRWRSGLPEFGHALEAARKEMLQRTGSRLHAATGLAVRALEEVARNTLNPAARVAAARAILELSHKAIELEDLAKRVEELEDWFEEQKGQGAFS